MKIQDIAFFLVFAYLLYRFQPRLSVSFGLMCLLLSIPLFAAWVFFTAERLTWYASGFFLLAIAQYIFAFRKKGGRS